MVSATSGANVLPYRFETWLSVRAWSATASATAGWAWPRETTASPVMKSRYGRPSASKSNVPSPRTKVAGGSAYVRISAARSSDAAVATLGRHGSTIVPTPESVRSSSRSA